MVIDEIQRMPELTLAVKVSIDREAVPDGSSSRARTPEVRKAFSSSTSGTGPRFVAGIVLNTGAGGFRYGDRLWGAPVSALWEFHG